MRKPAALTSLSIHVGAVALLFLLSLHPVVKKIISDTTPLFYPAPNLKIHDSGGGGGRALTRATKGEPPPKAVHKIFTPPTPTILNENPKLPIIQAMLDSDATVMPAVIGNPLSNLPGNSPGIGVSGIGIGDRNGKGGIGDDDGPRAGGKPGGSGPAARITRPALLLHKEEPEYSEEARKARWQGMVTLSIDIGVDGHPANIRVVHGVGLGLDERAIDAVRKWRFRPAYSGDRAIVTPALVEVTFHLL